MFVAATDVAVPPISGIGGEAAGTSPPSIGDGTFWRVSARSSVRFLRRSFSCMSND